VISVRLRFALHEVELPEGATTIGRDSSCTITLGGASISREHARIDLSDGRAVIRDLGSRNGVYVNGVRITEPQQLVDRDRVRIGTHELVASVAAVAVRSKRITGRGVTCSACGELHSVDRTRCPACGARTDAS
jgi:pSer/pThr/pTyr-binding forkhead associated (FHA) protein